MIRDEREKPLIVAVPANFDIDEGQCIRCGGQLDTGWECNDCGADHYPAVQALLQRRNWKR